MKKLIFKKSEIMSAAISAANYSKGNLSGAEVWCSLKDADGGILARKQIDADGGEITHGLSRAGEVEFDTESIPVPAMLNLEVSVSSGGKTYANSWNVWVYSGDRADLAESENFKIVSELDDSARDFLEKGGTLWIRSAPPSNAPNYGIGFSPIFWNTIWTNGQLPHTLGLLCDTQCAAFRDFPTQFHSNWQWQEIVRNAKPLRLDAKAFAGIKPIIQVVPDWNNPMKMPLAFEAKCGNGRVFASFINFDADAPNFGVEAAGVVVLQLRQRGFLQSGTRCGFPCAQAAFSLPRNA